MLADLHRRNILIGLYSSRGKVTLRPSLEHAGVLRNFNVVIDGGYVKNHKPHPEGVLKVLELLNVTPGDSVIIGDTTADILAGKAAGCALTIGITHGLGTRESLERAGADHVVDSLHELIPIISSMVS